jgi:uridine phosphorylase
MGTPSDSCRGFSHASNPGFDCSDGVVLLPFGRQSYLAAAISRYRAEQIELDQTTDRIVYRLATDDAAVTLVYSGMGGPAAANALEMIRANGGQRVVLIGACGGVDPTLSIGDLLIVTGAVRGDGTSLYYAGLDFPAVCDPSLESRLATTALAGTVTAHRGLVFTTDASYRQGPEVYETYRGMLLGVDSECSTAAVVSRRIGLAMGAILFCTDNITAHDPNDHAYKGLDEPRVRAAFEAALDTAVAVVAERADSAADVTDR